SALSLAHQGHRAGTASALMGTLQFGMGTLAGTAVTFETEFHDPDYHCTETNFRPEWSADGSSVEGVHVHVQDITARKLETLRLAQISRLDHLTQLLN
ncbi:hypothetical protein O6161_24970, partial [Salmonella enterica subsp. enterica]